MSTAIASKFPSRRVLKINRKVALLTGQWRVVKVPKCDDLGPIGDLTKNQWECVDGRKRDEPPDYYQDLNACWEMEEALSEESYRYKFGTAEYSSSPRSDYYQITHYGNPPCWLEDGTGKYERAQQKQSFRHLRGGHRATAAQKVEAFLWANRFDINDIK